MTGTYERAFVALTRENVVRLHAKCGNRGGSICSPNTAKGRPQVSVTSNGQTLSSPWSIVQSANPTFDGWWIRDPAVPNSTLSLLVLAPWQGDQNEMLGVYRVLGRNRPIVLSDSVQGQDAQVRCAVLSTAAYEALLALLGSQQVLLLQSPFGQQWYIRMSAKPGTSRSINGATRSASLQFSPADAPYYELTFDYVEVDRTT